MIKIWRMTLFKADLPRVHSINYTIGCMSRRHEQRAIIVLGKGANKGVNGSIMGMGMDSGLLKLLCSSATP